MIKHNDQTFGTAMKMVRRRQIAGFVAIVVLLSQIISCDSGNDTGSTYSLRGTISTPGFYAVDSDVNDPSAVYKSNDTLAEAQQVYYPVTLAGYLNLPGCGEKGRSFEVGDTRDFYRILLSEGDPIVLYIAAAHNTDLDLFLYRADTFALVDASLGAGRNESLRAPDDSEFIIEVRAISDPPPLLGASNYNLIVGGSGAESDSINFRLSHDFIPGEVILSYTNERTVSTSVRSLPLPDENFGMEYKKGGSNREMLFSFGEGTGIQSVFNALNIPASSFTRTLSTSASNEMQYKLDTLRVIKALQKRKDVKAVSPNFIRHAYMAPNDNYFNLQWHYRQIHLPEAWETTRGSGEVIVAVVDTGVLFGHPDLGSMLTSTGYDFVSSIDMEGSEPDEERGGIDPNPEDPGDKSTGGSSFHGTHVAGTISAATDNQLGVAGVGWNAARIMPLRALGLRGRGTSYDILQAVRYAAGLPNDSGSVPEKTADIINLSIGGEGFWSQAQSVYENISQSGIIVVAAAGNASSEEKSYPAAYEGVISVSAVDYASQLAYYSNYGETIDIAAPGGDNAADLNSDGRPDGVLSTVGDDTSGSVVMGYGFSQGTSMAAPHVAGVAALMKAVWPQMRYADFYNFLRSGQLTADLGPSGKDDYFGYGLINAQKAVLAAQVGVSPTAIIVNPPNIHLGTDLSTMTMWIEKSGDTDAELLITSVEGDAEWMQVAPLETDAYGLGSYTVSVDRTGLGEGVYSGTIEIVSTANDAYVPVSFNIIQLGRTISAGHHYVLLLEPETYDPLWQTEASLEDGIYHFNFSNVDKGAYLLFAGSDMDNDYVIGDLGNAIGAYLSTDQPVLLQVDRDYDDFEFKTEFNIQLSDIEALNSGQPFRIFGNVGEERMKSIQ